MEHFISDDEEPRQEGSAKRDVVLWVLALTGSFSLGAIVAHLIMGCAA